MSSNQLSLSASELKINIKVCTLCDGDLLFAAKPIFSFSVTSKILIVGQAPGIKMHESGIIWNGVSGDRLRECAETWMAPILNKLPKRKVTLFIGQYAQA